MLADLLEHELAPQLAGWDGLHSSYDPEAEAVLHVPPPCGAATLVFLGCGLGLHVRETLARNPQATRAVLIERHPELAPMAARALSRIDRRGALHPDRLEDVHQRAEPGQGALQ